MRTRLHRRIIHACARALCVALALFAFLPCARAHAETDGMLRVRLTRLGAPSEVVLRADCDYFLAANPSVRVPAGTDMTVAAAGGSLTLSVDGQRYDLGASAQLSRDATGKRGAVCVSPSLSNRLCGDLLLTASADVVTAVLRIYVEDYLYGVVGCEMPPSCDLEALKAQAIVARGYALRQKLARSGAAYDLADTGDTLVFRGYNDSAKYANAVRAVDETRGQALCWGEDLAACYFCESNGGQTESSANALGVSLPYTQVMDDPYDLEGKGLKKAATLPRDASALHPELTQALLEGMASQLREQGLDPDPSGVTITAIEDIVPESPRFAEPSRLYRTLAFTLAVTGKNAKGEATDALVTVRVPTYGAIEDWYELNINDADNETVWVTRSGGLFEIAFRRSGSGVGMSQRGAQAMAKKGLSCETILDYYYPGTTLRDFDLIDASRAQTAAQTNRWRDAKPIASARLSQKCRLYEKADASGGALTTLPAGATVAVYDVQGQWAAVGSGELVGFIHAEALSAFAPTGASPAQVQGEAYAQISADSVALSQLPVATAASLDTLSGGATVRLIAYTDEWARVTTEGGLDGFVPRSCLKLQADGVESENSVATLTEERYALLTEDAGLYVNADDSVAPRETLNKGAYVQILAYNSAWASARTLDGRSGYVKLSSLSSVNELPEDAEGGIEGGEITVLKDRPFRYVQADALPLYERYSEDSAVLVKLKKGEKVRLGAYNEKWACVRVRKTTGFVLLEGLSEIAPAEADIEGGAVITVQGVAYATVIADGAPMYASWSDATDPLTTLPEGAQVRLGAYNGAWACVRSDGVTGFMRLEALELPDLQ